MSNAKPLPNTSRYMRYVDDNGGDPFKEFTPRQLRRFRKAHNRIMGENGVGKVTPRQVPSRIRKPGGKRRG